MINRLGKGLRSKDMTLPNFLGIGAMRSGTSWLYEQLRAHKDVYMSAQKQLNFFIAFYDYGIEWYCKYFPSEKEAIKYKVIGEITPTYMAHPDVASRIHHYIPDCRFIVMLRNPTDRAYSEYTKTLRNWNFQGTFDDLVERHEDILARGYYAKQLERYFQFFPRNQFLILIFENTMSNPRAALEKLARFFEIDPSGFNLNRMQKKINASYLPRTPRLYSSAALARRYFAKNNMGYIDTMAARIGLKQVARYIFRFRGPRSELPKLDGKTRVRLNNLYSQEIRNLEKLLDEDLSIWKN